MPTASHEMRLVPQRGRHDCGAATLAMVAGVPYEVAAHLAAPHLRPGLTVANFLRICGDLGIPCEVRHRGDRLPWPCRPWAATHAAVVVGRHGSHYVAVNRAGLVLDPAGELPGFLSSETVISMVGLWPPGFLD